MLPRLKVDLTLMTGNVARVFRTNEDFFATPGGIVDALRPGGHLVFESRRPVYRAWTESNETRLIPRFTSPGWAPCRFVVTWTRLSFLLCRFGRPMHYRTGSDSRPIQPFVSVRKLSPTIYPSGSSWVRTPSATYRRAWTGVRVRRAEADMSIVKAEQGRRWRSTPAAEMSRGRDGIEA
jgi:hypothetical protein